MEFSGEEQIAAPRSRVWQALNDPAVLKAAIPGCEDLTKISDSELEATVKAAVGPVKARFKGKVTLSDLDPPNSYRLSGEGKGGAAGFAKGGAEVNLADAGENATVLRYTAHAQVGGKLASIGARLVDSAAKKLTGEFFANFRAQVEGAPTAPAAPPAPAAPEKAAPTAPAAPVAPAPAPPAARGLPPVAWGALVVLLIGLLLWWLLA
ncbi:MAG: carbon monoxide dehydrogenase [Alphaproteobacteria bacterium]|nr:MAG: carbon monoxide dehydrogenase [Alphaproteobacteria bacterium]